MKRVVTLAAAVVAGTLSVADANAQNGLQEIGVGSVQKSLGGAVTAAPRTSMTVMSNPAGLAVVGSRVDVGLDFNFQSRSLDFRNVDGVDTADRTIDSGNQAYFLPSFGLAAPLMGRDDLSIGFAFATLSNYGADFGESLVSDSGVLRGAQDLTFDGFSSFELYKFSPAVAYDWQKKVQVGLAANFAYQSIAYRRRLNGFPELRSPNNPAAGISQIDSNLDLGRPSSQFGFGFSVGVLVDIDELAQLGTPVSVGLNYTSQQFFNRGEYRAGTGDVSGFNGAIGAPGIYRLDLDSPQQLALGVSAKPTPELTLSLDFKWINWSGTHDEVELEGPEGSFDTDNNPLNGGEIAVTDLGFGWSDQVGIAVGAEYAVTPQATVRGGLNWMPSPIDDDTAFNNLSTVALTQLHLSVGGEYYFDDHWGVAGTYVIGLQGEVDGVGDISESLQNTTQLGADSRVNATQMSQSFGLQLSYRL